VEGGEEKGSRGGGGGGGCEASEWRKKRGVRERKWEGESKREGM